jgi:hypothetical protein
MHHVRVERGRQGQQRARRARRVRARARAQCARTTDSCSGGGAPTLTARRQPRGRRGRPPCPGSARRPRSRRPARAARARARWATLRKFSADHPKRAQNSWQSISSATWQASTSRWSAVSSSASSRRRPTSSRSARWLATSAVGSGTVASEGPSCLASWSSGWRRAACVAAWIGLRPLRARRRSLMRERKRCSRALAMCASLTNALSRARARVTNSSAAWLKQSSRSSKPSRWRCTRNRTSRLAADTRATASAGSSLRCRRSAAIAGEALRGLRCRAVACPPPIRPSACLRDV